MRFPGNAQYSGKKTRGKSNDCNINSNGYVFGITGLVMWILYNNLHFCILLYKRYVWFYANGGIYTNRVYNNGVVHPINTVHRISNDSIWGSQHTARSMREVGIILRG